MRTAKNPIPGFPSRFELENAIIESLHMFGGTATTNEIDQKVIEILNLPPEIVELEDDNDMSTKLSYRLRWCRTSLKSRNIIKNLKKGTWELV